jgi:hypothetical protein
MHGRPQLRQAARGISAHNDSMLYQQTEARRFVAILFLLLSVWVTSQGRVARLLPIKKFIAECSGVLSAILKIGTPAMQLL